MTETPQNRRLGYARVSTYGQTLDAQLEQLRADGCAKIFREKVTGARADRRELLKLLKTINPGDLVTVTRIDRLARSTFDLFAIVKQIVDAGGRLRSLADRGRYRHQHRTLDDCRSWRAGDVERDLIRTRTAEGRSRRRRAGSTWAVHRNSAAAAERSTAAAGGRRSPPVTPSTRSTRATRT